MIVCLTLCLLMNLIFWIILYHPMIFPMKEVNRIKDVINQLLLQQETSSIPADLHIGKFRAVIYYPSGDHGENLLLSAPQISGLKPVEMWRDPYLDESAVLYLGK